LSGGQVTLVVTPGIFARDRRTIRRMKLYVEPMDAVVVEIRDDGCVRLENEDWSRPTLQEQRAIIYSARNEIAELQELLDVLEQK
jgi:hypothetical protein